MGVAKINRQHAIFASSCVVILIMMITSRPLYMHFTCTSASIKDEDIFDSDQVQQYQSCWTRDEDQGFIRYIRRRWLVKPSLRAVSERKKTWAIMEPKRKTDVSQFGQSTFIDKQLKGLENFFMWNVVPTMGCLCLTHSSLKKFVAGQAF